MTATLYIVKAITCSPLRLLLQSEKHIFAETVETCVQKVVCFLQCDGELGHFLTIHMVQFSLHTIMICVWINPYETVLGLQKHKFNVRFLKNLFHAFCVYVCSYWSDNSSERGATGGGDGTSRMQQLEDRCAQLEQMLRQVHAPQFTWFS